MQLVGLGRGRLSVGGGVRCTGGDGDLGVLLARLGQDHTLRAGAPGVTAALLSARDRRSEAEETGARAWRWPGRSRPPQAERSCWLSSAGVGQQVAASEALRSERFLALVQLGQASAPWRWPWDCD